MNFTVIKEEDNGRLIEAKREVEDAFEKEKWHRIAEKVVSKGGDQYEGGVLARQYKKLMLSVDAMPPPSVRDPDFDGVTVDGDDDDDDDDPSEDEDENENENEDT